MAMPQLTQLATATTALPHGPESGRASLLSAMGPMAESRSRSPLAALSETDDAHLVEVEVPGVKREDLDIEAA